jgi:hypothetical protein
MREQSGWSDGDGLSDKVLPRRECSQGDRKRVLARDFEDIVVAGQPALGADGIARDAFEDVSDQSPTGPQSSDHQLDGLAPCVFELELTGNG